MKVVVCMDSWKGSLSAREACAAVAAGLRRGWPEADIHEVPLADGGEGTLDLVQALQPGEILSCEVCGPLPFLRVQAPVLFWPTSGEALIEVASCTGLTLLREAELDPLHSTSFGVGQLISAALTRGARRISLAVGGTATVDAGAGLAMALGWRFLDSQERPVPFGGAGLLQLARILPPSDPLPAFQMDVLCDVTNPLLGPRGAAAVFGPQKGATPAQVALLEDALGHFARVAARDLGQTLGDFPGGGAAGGIPAAARACFGAEIVPGIDRLLTLVHFAEHLREADWIVIGEGRVDEQSLHGKVLSGVLRAAADNRARIGVVAGSVDLDAASCRKLRIDRVQAARPAGMPLETALRQAALLAGKAAERFTQERGMEGGES